MMSLFGLFIGFSSLWTSHGAAILSIGDTLRFGESLNSSSFLVSPSGEFTLGFHAGYLILRSEYHTSWVANPGSPISDPSTALLTLDSTLTLRIQGFNLFVNLYSSPDDSTNVVASLLDSGNFVVHGMNQNSSSFSQLRVLWNSSDYPTLALMPGMKLGVAKRASEEYYPYSNEMLYSWVDNQNSSGPGSFTLGWHSGELQIWRDGVHWWTSGRFNYSSFPFISQTYSDDNEPPNILYYSFGMFSDGNEDYFLYSTAGSDPNATSVWVLHTNGELYDVGYNFSIVRAGECDGYKTSGGCIRWAARTGDCPRFPYPESDDEFVLIKNGSFKPINLDTSINSSWLDANGSRYGSDHCKVNCWKDCHCLGFDFLFDNQTGCRYWSVEYSHFVEDSANSTTSFILPAARIKIYSRNNGALPKWIWIGITFAVVLLALVLCSICYLIHRRKLAVENQRKIQDMLNMMNSNRPANANGLQTDGKRGHDLSVFKYSSIIAATCNFSDENKLGQGGFGPVYKGKLMTGQEVAVKRLSKCSGQGISEFKNELILIYELQHTNLVQLFGFCIHGEERMLIYEYMSNNSLDYFLFDSTRCQQLDWNKRFSIIEGIAQGLLYLHKYSRLRIIHRDLKASNVLLDESMNPKISDFGMARIFAHDEQEANTMKIVGTRGYMPPEYVMGGKFSMKSDVYSFGVLMLEILSGRKNNSFYNDERALNLFFLCMGVMERRCRTKTNGSNTQRFM